MKKKTWALLTVIIVLSALSLIAFKPSSSPKVEKAVKTENTTCCDKTIKDCPKKSKMSTAEDNVVESLSRQFISIAPAAYWFSTAKTEKKIIFPVTY